MIKSLSGWAGKKWNCGWGKHVKDKFSRYVIIKDNTISYNDSEFKKMYERKPERKK